MKTSNKLLLAFALSAVIVIGAINLALYGRFRQGEIITGEVLHKELFVVQDIPRPKDLYLAGFLRVNIIPADSFHIEFERGQHINQNAGLKIKKELQNEENSPRWQMKGDTLFIEGENRYQLNRWNPDALDGELPRVNIFGSQFRSIICTNVFLTLKGEGDSLRPVSVNAILKDNVICWIGRPRAINEEKPPAERFGSLALDAKNSTLFLSKSALISDLQVQLDDKSELSDHHAIIDKPRIHFTDKSRINITGSNLKKLSTGE